MKYVYIENNTVVDRVQVDPFTVFNKEYASKFIEAPEQVDHFWTYSNGEFKAPEPVVIEQPPAPTKEELLAQLQALSEQINALG